VRAWLKRWWPPLAMMAAIFAGSSLPGQEFPAYSGAWDFIIKKSGHLLEYGLLGALLFRSLRGGEPAHCGVRARQAWTALLAATAYGATDEFHQLFTPGRNGQPLDVLIDAVGAALGLGLYLWIEAIRRTRSRPPPARSNHPPA
jgi:VanZ family protein